MVKLCPWKKNIIKHENVTISNEEGINTRNANTDVDVDFGNCSTYDCPFYDGAGSVWCIRVTKGE